MKHYIIVKYTEDITDKTVLEAQVRALFSKAGEIPGVYGADVIPCCIARPNRYDLMIIVRMDKSALPAWDASRLHQEWKERFGQFVAKKAIFDEDEIGGCGCITNK